MAQDSSDRLTELEIRLCFLEERLEALEREQLNLLRHIQGVQAHILRLEKAIRPQRDAGEQALGDERS